MPAWWCGGASVERERLDEWGVVWRRITFGLVGYTAPKKQYKAADYWKIFISSCCCLTSVHCSALPKIFFLLYFAFPALYFTPYIFFFIPISSLYLLPCSLSLLSSNSCPTSQSPFIHPYSDFLHSTLWISFSTTEKKLSLMQWKCLCKSYKVSSKK